MVELTAEQVRCSSCREEISAGARKCPHCHAVQGRFAVWFHRLGPFLVLLPIVFLALTFQSAFRSSVNFSEYRDSLIVVKSAAHYSNAAEKCGATISVIGTIRNNSDVPWEDVYLEVRYFDSAGSMVDTESVEHYSLLIPPRGEVAFRVRGPAIRPEQDYVSHKVAIVGAKDAGSLF
jgi:hypothetical protein